MWSNHATNLFVGAITMIVGAVLWQVVLIKYPHILRDTPWGQNILMAHHLEELEQARAN